jgi:hypothetical protein
VNEVSLQLDNLYDEDSFRRSDKEFVYLAQCLIAKLVLLVASLCPV